MNELSLFTGIGGGLLGTKLLGWNHIGYVEWDKYCCKVLEQRIKDEILDDAPIWNIDIREFNKRYAEMYRGVVDIITAGFPCQPFSVAGKRQGADDERNMWPATIECIRLVRPRYTLLENVPGLLASGYFGTILRDLAESGYDIRWMCIRASDVGAKTLRERWFGLGWDNKLDVEGLHFHKGTNIKNKLWGRDKSYCLSNVETTQLVADNMGSRIRNDVSEVMEPIRAIGNAQVPAVVKTVWELLTDDA
jgi:DNA (cytosine-5)-methyltransferase 1